MYFEAYLKSRNAPPSHQHSQQISQVSTETSSKFTMLRPPSIQATSMTAKSPFNDGRGDNTRSNTSGHGFLSAAIQPSMSHRVSSNYPIRTQTNPVSLAAFSRHQMPQDQKYVCLSPGKGGGRTSAGLVFEQIPQNRYDYRRSESINEVKPNGESFRQGSINYCPQGRQNNEVQDAKNSTVSDSQFQLRFNPYPQKGKMTKKDSVDEGLLTNRQERTEPPYIKQPYSQKKIFKEYSQLFQYKPQIPSFDRNKFEYISARPEPQPKKYDFQARKLQIESKKSEAYKTFQEVYRNSLKSVLDGSELRKQTSQDFLKKSSNNKFLDHDKYLEQDIQTLRLASQKSDEVVDRQLSKNNYLNQLFEQKGLRTFQEKPELKETFKQKKEAAARHIAFERELQERNSEILEKGRQLDEKRRQIQQNNQQLSQKKTQIEEKNKLIEGKDKKIEELSAQLKELQYNILKKESKWTQLQNNHKNQLKNTEKRLIESVSKVAQLQTKIKQDQQIFNSRQQQKDKIVIFLQSNLDQQRKKVQSLQNQFDNTTKGLQIYQTTIDDQLTTIKQYQKKSFQLTYLQAEIVQLKQRNNLLQDKVSNITKQHKETQQKYDIISEQYLQIGTLLLLPEGFLHQKLTSRLKQCLQGFSRSQGMQLKEIQRVQQYQMQKMQQEHLQRRHQELSRQLKKVGSRLAAVSIEAQHCLRMLREANQTIIYMNLLNLNEKYRFLLESQ